MVQVNSDQDERGDWPRQRAALRTRLIAAREALPPAHRAAASAAIARHLEHLVARLAPREIGFCWPYRGEFDCRPFVSAWLDGDAARVAALPVIVAPAAAMAFRRWTPDTGMAEGRYGIPIPAQDIRVMPQLLLMPLNGFDARGYRLGYGGGYFDRTLAALAPRPWAVGIGFELARLERLEPDPHDIPMDFLITEAGAFEPVRGAAQPGLQK